ncbi:hypothetical protein IWW36_001427 [Coemansia brasiliensis]|uniref:Uncharacterized protein n=1 Tax=Coemansia brasiliensis TaxID=2650707 RepID=A0A9W8I8V9_9FUNG|nr:hypothetical protein IWW36_001427 [Coemansia brasiliensis]
MVKEQQQAHKQEDDIEVEELLHTIDNQLLPHEEKEQPVPNVSWSDSTSKGNNSHSSTIVVPEHFSIPCNDNYINHLLDRALLSPDSAAYQTPVLIADVLEPWMAHFEKGPIAVKSNSWVHKKRLEMSIVPRVYTRRLRERLLPLPIRKLKQNRSLREWVVLHEQLKEVKYM